MHIKGIIFSALIFGVSLPVMAEECPPDKPLITEKNICQKAEKDENGNLTVKCELQEICHSCDELFDLGTTEENCNLCSNRYFVHVGMESNAFILGNYCTLKECPKGYFKASSGCRPCNDEEEDIRALESFKEECEKCPERIFGMGLCVLKNKPFSEQFCNDKRSWYYEVTKEMCDKCPNREYKDGHCNLKICPEGTFKNQGGDCFECGNTLTIVEEFYKTSEQECAKCSNREYINGKCALKECPQNMFKNKEGYGCYRCEEEYNIPGRITSEQECSKCPNRKYVNGECVLK